MLILASKSPRRRELIAKLQIPFTVSPADADECLPDGIAPMDAVRMLAERKCAAARRGGETGTTSFPVSSRYAR